ncbi:MAG: hypothetical protein Q9164_005536 [Protoblastenia rupestris]
MDEEDTPRPYKKRIFRPEAIPPSPTLSVGLSLSSRSEDSVTSDDLESHKSGRMSPRKQVAIVEDQEQPVVFYDFVMSGVEIPEDVEDMRAKAQRLADGIGILGQDTASMDPKDLASASLPKRIIDYCYTLIPDEKITDAWRRLRPLPKAIIKNWNNTTYNMVRASPIAVNIETKAPDKSWTDGKAQLGIWITSMLSRLRLLPQYDSASPQPAPFLSIPAMPLIIVQ